MSDELAGRVAVVTGGGTGIGRAIARRFSRAGARVVVAGRTQATIEAVASEVAGVAIVCDVTDRTQVERMFARAHSLTGFIDIVVNNAGQSGPIAAVSEVDPDAFRMCVDINLIGAMHVMSVATRHMCSQQAGSIINMSSLMGLRGYPMRSAYCATKFAIIGMTEAVAREVGPNGVRVNALCPGAVAGELMDAVIESRALAEKRRAQDIIKESYCDVSALRRWVDADEVASAALFLASDAASAITGETIKVDCGRF